MKVTKLGKGGNWEAILEKPEIVCPWKSPYSHGRVLLCSTFSGRRQQLSHIPTLLPSLSLTALLHGDI